jgi:hypothetical protein
MAAPTEVSRVPCTHCRSDIVVTEQYAHGDHIKCGSCGTKHKVVRGDRVRLVIADVGPIKDALVQNEQLVQRLEAELSQARGSFGIGANGIGIAVAYAIYELTLKDAPLGKDLLWSAIGIAVASGLVLEAVNYLFLAKRQAISRFTEELEEARSEGVLLRQKIREAGRI